MIEKIAINSLMMLILLNIIALICSIYIQSVKNKYDLNLLANVEYLPLPAIIVHYSNNTISKYNSLFAELIQNKENLNNVNLGELKLFDDFSNYLDIKKECSENGSVNKKIKFTIDNITITIGISAKLIIRDDVKYLLIMINDKADLINYAKYLGIFSTIASKSTEGIIVARSVYGENEPNIIYINNSLLNMLGSTENDMLHKPLTSVFKNYIDEDSSNEIIRTIDSKQERIIECECEFNKHTNIAQNILSIHIIPIDNQQIKKTISELKHLIHEVVEFTDNDIYIIVKQVNVSQYTKNIDTIDNIFNKINKNTNNKLMAYEKIMSRFVDFGDSFTSTSEEQLICTLKMIGEILNVDRVYAKKIAENGTVSLINKWLRENVNEVDELIIKSIPQNTINIAEDDYILSEIDLYANLITNKIRVLNISDCIEDRLIQLFHKNEIKSIIICPIFDHNSKLCGYVAAHDCHNSPREWDEVSKKVMQILSSNIVGKYV